MTRLSPPDFSKPFAKAVAKRLGASRCADWFVMGEEVERRRANRKDLINA